MDFFICIGFCICVMIALTGYYIAHVVRQAKKGDDQTKIDMANKFEIRTEFETSTFNAEIVDLSCRAMLIGDKYPKAVNVYTVVFVTDKNEQIKLNVPQEMYDGLEVGQKGELTLVEGELYSFVV